MSKPKKLSTRPYYSHEYPGTPTDPRVDIARIPPRLLRKFRARCKRDGVSMRTATLRLWDAWATPIGER